MKLSAGWARVIFGVTVLAVSGIGIASVALKQVDINKTSIKENKEACDEKMDLLRQSIEEQTKVQVETRTDVKWIKEAIKNGN